MASNDAHLPQSDLHQAVRAARIELAAAIEALTAVLETVANSDSDKNTDINKNDHHDSQRSSSIQPAQRSEQLPPSASAAIPNAQARNKSQLPPVNPTSQQQSQSQQQPSLHQSKQGSQQPESRQSLLQQGQSQSAQQSSGSQPDPASLGPVLIRLNKLRSAVNEATRLRNETVAHARSQEDAVSPQERAVLEARRSALIDQVHAKNERMKLLIDHLRELYRDSLTFRNNLKIVYPRHGTSLAKN